MAGKQAKTLATDHIDDLMFFAERSRHPLRNRLIVLTGIGTAQSLTRSLQLDKRSTGRNPRFEPGLRGVQTGPDD